MSQQPLSILISGAGVAGGTLAFALARQPGFKMKPLITLIERSPVPRTTGQAIDIRGPGVDVIRRLGLEPDIKARHTSETGMTFLNEKGGMVAKFEMTGDSKNQGVTSEYEILRGELTGLLLDGVAEARKEGAHVNVVNGESIESLDEQDDGVNVRFKYGKLDHQKFDVVVAADGIGSKARSMIFGKEDRAEHIQPSGMYIAFFTVPRIEGDSDLYRWCIIPGGLGMHLRPHRDGKNMGVYLAITNAKKAPIPELEAILKSDVASQKAYLRKRFENAGWQSERFLAGSDQSNDFYMTHWCQVRTPSWTKGRCAILGDAAFATMGIGTSLSMIGAYIIAGELSKIQSSQDVPTALRNYEGLLRPYFKKHEAAPPGFPQALNPQTKLGVGILQTILRLVVALRIPKLLIMFFGGEGKEKWKLPEYGWSRAC